MHLLPPSRILLGVILALLVVPAHAQKRKSSAPPSTPAPTTVPTPTGTPAAKPAIALPLSPRSATAAAQILEQAKAAGTMLGQTKYGASIKASVSVHPLPPREPGHETHDERANNLTRSDFDWAQLRAIGDRFWLVGPEQLTVSDPNTPAKWADIRWPNLGVQFVDVFQCNNRVWLLSTDWVAESSPDGTQLLSVPLLAPRLLSVTRNLAQLTGSSVKRTEPLAFGSVQVWGKAWIGNRHGAFFTFADTLENVPLGDLGGDFSLIPFDSGLAAFGTPINGGSPVVLRTADGKNWTRRPGLSDFARGTDGKVAFGKHRFVRANSSTLSVSADGVIWRDLPAPLFPPAMIEVKKSDGTYVRETRPVLWNRVIYEGDFFLALGTAFTPGVRHEKRYPIADLAVAAVSDDGCSWTTIPLPVAAPSQGQWLAAGHNGTFLVTPRYRSKTVAAIRLTWEIPPFERNPANRHPAERGLGELKATAEEAVKNRDIPKVARALLELEHFYPSEETARISASLRAQLGDLDGAWSALNALERVVPDDFEVAALRTQLLQAAGRATDAQAYARWFLAQKHSVPTGDARTVLAAKIARFNLLVGASQLDDAQRFAENEALRDKTNVEFRLLLGLFHAQRRQFPLAKRWLGEAAALGDPRAKQLLTQLPQQ